MNRMVRRGTELISAMVTFVALVATLIPHSEANAATHRTRNFVVHAATDDVARQVGEAAEVYRRELAIEWLGHEFKPWSQPCPVTVRVGSMGAGGATTFTFDRGEVYNWNMRVQGSLERILDSVLPHEISHTIFATHFRRPLPRWADEGAATLVEHESERRRQSLLAQQLLRDETRIPLKSLLAIKEYPQDMQKVLMLYAEGYTLSSFLVERGGKARFIRFLADAHQSGWETALNRHYQYQEISDLQQEWDAWILAGEPTSAQSSSELASVSHGPENQQALLVRSQTPEEDPSQVEPRETKSKSLDTPNTASANIVAETTSADEISADTSSPASSLANSRDRARLTQPLLTVARRDERSIDFPHPTGPRDARPSRANQTHQQSTRLSRDRLNYEFRDVE